jgi:Mrp family chromosome partitioning ATPase
MSALDQAFIKAFAKEPTTTIAPPRPAAARGTTASPAESPRFDELYDAGTFYRVDAEAAERAVPAMHLAPDRKVPRRLQRRNAARSEFEIEIHEPPAPVVPEAASQVPPRRNWSRSMLDIARQLAQYDLLNKDVEVDLPPHIIALDPTPLHEPAPPPPPAKHVELAPAPAEKSSESIPLPSQAIAQLWSVDAEIMTSSVVAYSDVETWLALPMAPSIACHENLADSWVQQHLAERPQPATDSTTSDPFKKKRKLRLDASHPRMPRPHQRPELPLVKPAAEEVPAPPAVEAPPVVVEAAPIVESAPVVEVKAVQPVVEQVAEAPAPVAAVVEKQVTVGPEVQPTADAVEPEVQPTVMPSAPTTIPKRPYVPLWEVDRFTWPAICDKLMHDPSGYFASASNKLLSVVRGGLKVLGITGSRRGEGRTTLALCLARAAAQAGIHVALVDADFTRPQLASMLGLETAYGWQEAATGKIPLSEAAVKSLADRVTVLPLEVSATDEPLSLADPRVTATLRATAATFELVIVDLGPLTNSSESLFPPEENCPLDAAIVVRDTRYATVNESRLAGDRLYDAGIEAVGIAENFVTEPEIAFL